jgi:hypothetical protein
MARFIEVPAQGATAIVNVDEIAFVTPSGPSHCNVQFAAGATLHVATSMNEMMGRMLGAKPIE